MKKIISVLAILFCFVHSYSMEEKRETSEFEYNEAGKEQLHEDDQNVSNKIPLNFGYSNLGDFEVLPNEILCKIIKFIIEDRIKNSTDIINFRVSLWEELNKIGLIAKDFRVFKKKELKNFIKPLVIRKITFLKKIIKKHYKDLPKKELNRQLIGLIKQGSANTKQSLEEAVRLIIAGADVNLKDFNKHTILMWAAYLGYTEIVKLLIAEGADLNLNSRFGESALSFALRSPYNIYDDIEKIIIENGIDPDLIYRGGESALTLAWNNIEIANLLIKKRANLNLRIGNGWTALMRAAWKGHLEMVKLLIDNGADINIKNENGKTALTFAKERGHIEIERLLKEANQNNSWLNLCSVQ